MLFHRAGATIENTHFLALTRCHCAINGTGSMSTLSDTVRRISVIRVWIQIIRLHTLKGFIGNYQYLEAGNLLATIAAHGAKMSCRQAMPCLCCYILDQLQLPSGFRGSVVCTAVVIR